MSYELDVKQEYGDRITSKNEKVLGKLRIEIVVVFRVE